MLEAGETAPDFALEGVFMGETETYRLSEYADEGTWVMLSFYAFDFSPICTEGACSLRDAEFLQFEDDLAVLGISGDSVYSHEQFAEQHHLNYPLLADTGRTVGEKYGAVRDSYEGMERVHRRGAVVVDPSRTVRRAFAADAEDPDDVNAGPLVDAVRRLRG